MATRFDLKKRTHTSNNQTIIAYDQQDEHSVIKTELRFLLGKDDFSTQNFDVIIIGGGFLGASMAYQLSRTGLHTLLLEAGLNLLAHDDTILCRCEDITLEEVKAAVAAGARTIGEVKMITRSGMGNCQGRMCERSVTGAIIRELIDEQVSPEMVGAYSIRPPLQPLPLEYLAKAGTEENL